MPDMSNFLADKLLRAALNGETYTGSTLYLALYTDDAGTEVTDVNYERQVITFNAPSYVNGQINVDNSNSIDFAPAASSYGTVTHIGILDTNGNTLFYRELNTPIVVSENSGIRLLVGDLTISLN